MTIAEVYDENPMTQEDAFQFIEVLFDGYAARKRKKDLYRPNDPVPRMIIEMYYRCIENPDFDEIYTSFKRKYILNESKLEDVHTKEERQGLGIVYDYIHGDVPVASLGTYTLPKLHQLLFSKVAYPEFGGQFRNEERYLPGSGVDLLPWREIPEAMQKVYVETLPLFSEGIEIGKTKEISRLIPYINRCIELNYRLIEIHPFGDGNGRSIRALTNLMFKLVNIPPVYVKASERLEYQEAMHNAIALGDDRDIKTFYYYKICDSILELGIRPHKLENNLGEKNKTYVKK